MKAVFIVCALAVVCVYARPDEHYTDRYDNINVQEILDNQKLLAPFVKCALDQGKCTPEGKELKAHIKEAMETYCAKCTEIQKKETKHVIGHLINKEPAYWTQLTAKYDPEDKYTKKYEDELKTIVAEAKKN